MVSQQCYFEENVLAPQQIFQWKVLKITIFVMKCEEHLKNLFH